MFILYLFFILFVLGEFATNTLLILSFFFSTLANFVVTMLMLLLKATLFLFHGDFKINILPIQHARGSKSPQIQTIGSDSSSSRAVVM